MTATFSHAQARGTRRRGKDCATCHAAIRDDRTTPSCRARPSKDCASRLSRRQGRVRDDGRVHALSRRGARALRGRAPRRALPHDGTHADAVAKRAVQRVSSAAPQRRGHGRRPRRVRRVSRRRLRRAQAEDLRRVPQRDRAVAHARRRSRAARAHRVRRDARSRQAHAATCATLSLAAHRRRTQLRPPRGHRRVHRQRLSRASTADPRRSSTHVRGCHRARPRRRTRARRACAAPWSVRATFDHATHATTQRQALACTACHTTLAGADARRARDAGEGRRARRVTTRQGARSS